MCTSYSPASIYQTITVSKPDMYILFLIDKCADMSMVSTFQPGTLICPAMFWSLAFELSCHALHGQVRLADGTRWKARGSLPPAPLMWLKIVIIKNVKLAGLQWIKTNTNFASYCISEFIQLDTASTFFSFLSPVATHKPSASFTYHSVWKLNLVLLFLSSNDESQACV